VITSLIYRLVDTTFGRWLLHLTFRKMTFLIPAKRLRETETLLAFHHPKPAYQLHIILVPRKPVATLLDLNPEEHFLPEFLQTVQELVKEFRVAEGGYRLIVNGGGYQDFPHLHFHLISDVEATDRLPLPK